MSDRPAPELRLRLRLRLARAALVWERLWPAAWPAVCVIAVFAVLALFDLLPALPGVREVAVYGSLLHVVVDPSPERTALLRKDLETRGIKVQRVEEVRPSLEDVFISAVGSVGQR